MEAALRLSAAAWRRRYGGMGAASGLPNSRDDGNNKTKKNVRTRNRWL